MTYPSEVLADSPLAYYRLGEPSGSTMVDASGNARDGAYTGVTLGVAGAAGDGDTALTTAGASTSVGATAFASWMTVTTALSMEAWVKWTGSPGTSFFWARTGGSSYNSGLFVTGGNIGFGVRAGSSLDARTSSGGFNDGQWHHVVGTYDGSTIRLYVDGAQVATNSNTGNVVSASNGLQVGGRGSNYFAGSVDEAAYYNAVLSPTRIGAHFSAPSAPAEGLALDAVVPAPAATFDIMSPVDQAGSWSWWTRPRAVAIDGKIYVGSATQAGEVVVDEYDADTGDILHRHVIKSGVTFDDHNNPALIIEPGQPPIVMWQRHAATDDLHYAIGTQPIEDGFTWGAEQLLDFTGDISYSAAHVVDGTIYVVTRVNPTSWRLVSSADWGTSWTAAKTVGTHAEQMYVASVLADDGRIRFAATAHPRFSTAQSIYYAELDLATDTLYKRDGTVIGTIGGSAPAMTSWDVAAAPTTGYHTWAYDVSGGEDREIVWAQMDDPDAPTVTEYLYTTDASGSWVTDTVVAAGAPFGAEAAPDDGGNYLGGAQFVEPGKLVVSREAAGTWHVDYWTTTDAGANWTTAPIATSASQRLARAWKVEPRDATPAGWIAVNVVTPPFDSYVDHASDILLYVDDPASLPITVSLAGQVRRPVASFSIGTSPVVQLAGTMPRPIAEFAIETGNDTVSLVGVVPPLEASFQLRGSIQGYTTLGNDRRRNSIGYATWEPPVVEPPAAIVHDKIQANGYQSVTVTEGAQPVVVGREVKTADRARTRIVVAGRDITYWRGVPTPAPTYSLVSPLLYGAGSLELPQVHAAFETPGEGALSWLAPWAPVKVQRVVDGAVVATDFRGFLMEPQVNGRTLTFGLVGQATGPAKADYRPPRIFRRRNDLGHWWDRLLQMVKVQRAAVASTGIKLQNRGDMDLLQYAQELSQQGVTRSGNQWTAMVQPNGVYKVARKDTTTIEGTVYFDDAHTVPDLRRDPLEETNTVYATGISPEGRRIRFADYPALQLPIGEVPDWPGLVMEGDTDDAALTVVVRLWQVGYLSYEDRPGGFDADVTRAVKDLQEDAGLFISGDVDEATWKAMFDFEVTGYNLAGANIRPAAQKKALRKYRRTASGAILGRNPSYDPHAKVVAKAIDVGPGFNQQQVRDFARMEIHEGATANWTGTIRFELGGYIPGEHTPGDPIGGVRDARDLKPGHNLWAPLFDGGTLFHVSGVEVSAGDGGRPVVTASVDTRARDTMEVWEVIQRNRESRRNPARQWLREFRSSYLNKDSVTEWDDLGGTTPDRELNGGQWNVFPVVAGQEGTVARLRLQLNTPTEFVVGVFGRRVGRGILAGRIGNPLSEAGSERWTDSDVTDELRNDRVLLYVAGDDSSPCGYFPKTKDEGSSFLTGRWEDDASFGYRCFDDYSLWVAIYPAEDCTLQGGRIMWNQLESGA